MSRESQWARINLNYSARCREYEDIISLPMKTKSGKLLRLTAALIFADREERKMDAFITDCNQLAGILNG
ncbi:hypothetical protein [Pantoea agglomerans]|uniref:hypothetical protein n=1 Tax=Enterobacter agglomerans TaxID=549 RepID=UPI00177CC1A9|nr:hypothetical protein [Pantoea agglomerans]MBD8133798.1 hypothetical protein [Pantoea agglomerans]